ncbi:unnamed protein product, partial [Hapterophycus canaliculatus]
LASDLSSLDDALHAYDGAFTHCTVATLSSFKNIRSPFFHASAVDQDRVIQAWHQSLTAAFARTEGLLPFELVFKSLETSPAATFLLADDASKTIEGLRSAIKEAASTPVLSKLSAELEKKHGSAHPELCSLKEALHVPDIIHSTVMRLAAPPSDADRLAEGLAGLAMRWQPATVRVAEISLVYEKHPYMHLDREESEVRCYRLPFGSPL